MQKSNQPGKEVVAEQGSSGDPQAFVSQLIRRIPPNESFSVREILQLHPFLNEHRSCLVDLAYEEFCRLREAGNPISPTEFAGRYGEIEQSLHRVIEFDQILQEHPSFIESVPDEQWPATGEQFCDCLLLEQIGRGVLSRVFVALQEKLGKRRVVAKICARGEQEATLLGRLDHEAIAAVHSIDTNPVSGLSVICMPYLTRVTLHHVAECLNRDLNREPFSTSDVQEIVDRFNSEDSWLEEKRNSTAQPTSTLEFADLFLQWGIHLADALAAAHRIDILHCDVKPGNVLVLPDLRVQLLDFNLAASAATADRLLGGTLPFMASEQLLQLAGETVTPFAGVAGKSKSVTGLTDVFGLCATLWHVATGQPPFGVALDAANRTASARLFLQRQAEGLQSDALVAAARVLPERVVEILVAGLSADPAARPQSAAVLSRMFKDCLETSRDLNRQLPSRNETALGPQTEAVSRPRFWTPVRRLLAAVVVAFVLGVVSLVTSEIGRGRTHHPEIYKQVRELLRGGKFDKAHDLVVPERVRLPDNTTLAALYVRSLIGLGRIREAGSFLLNFNSAFGSNGELLSLELYTRCLLLEFPVRNPDIDSITQSGSEIVSDSASWAAAANEWLQLEARGEAGGFARLNAAAIFFEIQDYSSCGQLIRELDVATLTNESAGVLERIAWCLKLREAATGQTEMRLDELNDAGRQEYGKMSRSELLALMQFLILDIQRMPRDPANALSRRLADLKSLVEQGGGGRLAPGDIQRLLWEKNLQVDQYMNQWFAERAEFLRSYPIQNQLVHLLVLPPEVGVE